MGEIESVCVGGGGLGPMLEVMRGGGGAPDVEQETRRCAPHQGVRENTTARTAHICMRTGTQIQILKRKFCSLTVRDFGSGMWVGVLTLWVEGPWVKDAGETGAGLGGALVHALPQRLQPEQRS
jgi:hypothetical protein